MAKSETIRRIFVVSLHRHLRENGKRDSLTRPQKRDSLTRPHGVFIRSMPSRKRRIPPDALNLNELQVYWPAARRRNATNRTVRCERLWTMSHGCLILELHARQGLAGRRAWNPIDGIRFQRRQNTVGTGQAVPFLDDVSWVPHTGTACPSGTCREARLESNRRNPVSAKAKHRGDGSGCPISHFQDAFIPLPSST